MEVTSLTPVNVKKPIPQMSARAAEMNAEVEGSATRIFVLINALAFTANA